METYTDGNENMGGVIQIEFANIVEILDFPEIKDDSCISEIQFEGGASFSDSFIVENKASFNSNSNDDDQGTLHPSVLSVIFPKYSKDILLSELFKSSLIAKVTFANGDKIIMGYPSHPLIVSYNADTGLKSPDFNHVVISFSHSAPVPCPFYPF